MAAAIHAILGGGGGKMRLLLALSALVGLLAVAALSLAPAAADGHDSPELVISLVEDSDNIVPAGSTLTVQAQLRYATPAGDVSLSEIRDGSNLRISGALDWDNPDIVGSSFTIPPEIFGVPATEIIPMDGASPPMPFDNNAASPGTAGNGAWPVAYDSRTFVAYAGTSTGSLLVFDTQADPPAQVAKIDAAAATEKLGIDAFSGIILSRPVAVWDQNDTTAWIFAGAPEAGTDKQGKLSIYKLTYTASGATVSTPTDLAPPDSEVNNRNQNTANQKGYYGRSVSISADGQTLAVGASGMNMTGAAYVYTMPSGAGQDWSNITYAAGVKVTPVQVPSWGTSVAATQPFDEESSTVGDAYNQCDAYCSSVSASDGSFFGAALELSADGSTLVVAAPIKRFASNTPGGTGFANPTTPLWAGSVWVFTAPEGGWSAAPDATTGKTLIAAAASAGSWDPATNYSPGPAKRVESADAELTPAAWGATRTAQEFFGHPVNISADGSTIVATARRMTSPNSHVYVFAKPAGGWADTTTPTSTIVLDNDDAVNDDIAGAWGTDVNHDGRRILIEDAQAATATTPPLADAGLVYVFDRPAAGWTASLTEDDNTQIFRAPTPQANGQFSAPLYNNAGTLAVFADTDYNGITGTAPKFFLEEEGIECADRTLDGSSTTTCPLSLGNTAVTVPAGTPDGSFIISGRVNARFSDGEEAENVRGSLEVTIGKVTEVASVELAIANNPGDPEVTGDAAEGPYPSVLRTQGDSTRLQLRILNENGQASHAGSVAAVLISSSAGNLGVVDTTLRGEACTGISCQLDNTKINASNADRLLITLSHTGRAGSADVRATVFSTTGESFETSTVSIALAGPAESIALAAPTSGVLNVNTVTRDNDGVEQDDEDNRDRLLLALTALDTAGNNVALPAGARRSKVLDPNGAALPPGSLRVIFPHRPDPTERATAAGGTNAPILTAARAEQVRIDIDRPATNPLPSGEYTLQFWAGAKMTEQTFTVSGGPVADGISLSDPGVVGVGESFTVTATFNDASGVAVPNGTVVDWPEILSTGGAGQLVVQTSKDTRTSDGQASASFLAVNSGSVVVTAGADCRSVAASSGASATICNVSGVRLVNIQAAAAAPASLVDGLSRRAPGGLSTWLGESRTSAAELLSALDGVNSILIWLNGSWVRYGVANGQRIPGSIDFNINTGAVLWLGR